jgi:hypothetical protein
LNYSRENFLSSGYLDELSTASKEKKIPSKDPNKRKGGLSTKMVYYI